MVTSVPVATGVGGWLGVGIAIVVVCSVSRGREGEKGR
jgi:hypothetical protein